MYKQYHLVELGKPPLRDYSTALKDITASADSGGSRPATSYCILTPADRNSRPEIIRRTASRSPSASRRTSAAFIDLEPGLGPGIGGGGDLNYLAPTSRPYSGVIRYGAMPTTMRRPDYGIDRVGKPGQHRVLAPTPQPQRVRARSVHASPPKDTVHHRHDQQLDDAMKALHVSKRHPVEQDENDNNVAVAKVHPTHPILSHLRQSPIDIRIKDVVHDMQKCGPISLLLARGDADSVNVTGGCWKATMRPKNTSALRGHHLPGVFRLAQFHAHWDSSEHTLDGRRFDGEIHFVFQNPLYRTCEEALKHGDGFAVLAVFIEIGAENAEFSVLLESILESARSGASAKIGHSFDMNGLIPKNGLSSYFTYLGGLTTPPYAECVIWTLLEKPIQLSEKQISALKQLTPANWRECQKLFARRVYAH